MRKLYAVAVSMLLLAGTPLGQQQTDWTSASNNPDIQCRPVGSADCRAGGRERLFQ